MTRQELALKLAKKAFSYINKEEKWIQGAYARDSKDEVVEWDSPRAERFCSIGALNRARKKIQSNEIEAAHNYLRLILHRNFGSNGIIIDNDSKTYAEIRKAWKDTIADLKEDMQNESN